MKFLEGTQIEKDSLKEYVGHRIIYLFSRDIDKSGRGYYFPRTGTITFCNKRNIDFDDTQEYLSLSDLREAVLATSQNIKANFKSNESSNNK